MTEVAAPRVYTQAYLHVFHVCSYYVFVCVCAFWLESSGMCSHELRCWQARREFVSYTNNALQPRQVNMQARIHAHTLAHMNVRLLKPHTFTKRAAIVVLKICIVYTAYEQLFNCIPLSPNILTHIHVYLQSCAVYITSAHTLYCYVTIP